MRIKLVGATVAGAALVLVTAPGAALPASDVVLLASIVALHLAVVLLDWAVGTRREDPVRLEFPVFEDSDDEDDDSTVPAYPVIWTPHRQSFEVHQRVEDVSRRLLSRLSLCLSRVDEGEDEDGETAISFPRSSRRLML